MGKDHPVLSKREIKPPKRYEDDHVSLNRKQLLQQERPSLKVGSKVSGKSVDKVSQGYSSTVAENCQELEREEKMKRCTEIVKDGGLIFRGNMAESKRATSKEIHKEVNDTPLSGASKPVSYKGNTPPSGANKPVSCIDNTDVSYSVKNIATGNKQNTVRGIQEFKDMPKRKNSFVEIPMILVKSCLNSRDRQYKCVLCPQLFDKLYHYEEHWASHVEPESSNGTDFRSPTAEEAISSDVSQSRAKEGSVDSSFTVLERNVASERMQTTCHVPRAVIDEGRRTTLIDDDLALQNMTFKGSNTQFKGNRNVADSATKLTERKQNEFQQSPDSGPGTKSLSTGSAVTNSSAPLPPMQMNAQSDTLDVLSQVSKVLFSGKESSDSQTVSPRTESEIVNSSLPRRKYDETDQAEIEGLKKAKENKQIQIIGNMNLLEYKTEQASTVEKKALSSPKKGLAGELKQQEIWSSPRSDQAVIAETGGASKGNDAVITQTIDHTELKDIVNIDEIISEVVIQNQNYSADSQNSDDDDCVEEYEDSDDSMGSNGNGAPGKWPESGGKHNDVGQFISLANDLEERIRVHKMFSSNAIVDTAVKHGGSIGKKIKVEKKTHRCELCNKEFDRAKYLKRHIKTCHKSAVSNGLCKHCGLMFAKSSLLRRHQREVHSAKKTTVCFICNQTFTDLESHMKSVHQKMSMQPLKCPHCWWATGDVLEYKKHVAKHVGEEKPFDCKDCGKRFRTKMLYGMHIRIHERGFRYPCSVCGHRFNQASNLKRHMTTNHDMADFKPPFQCDMCVQSFLTQEILDKHRARHSRGVFCCKKCGMVFPNRNQLTDHNRLDHKRIRFECHHCDAVFPYGNKLKLHIESKHPDRSSFDCTQCGKQFRTQGFLDNHIREKRCFSTRQCKRCKISFDAAGMERHQKCHLNTETVVNKFCFICGLFLKTVKDVYDHGLEHMRTLGNNDHDSSDTGINNSQERVDSLPQVERHNSFSCHLCSESFDELKDYCDHLSKHDNDANDSPIIAIQETSGSATGEIRTPHSCLLCSDTFDELKDYRDHLSSHNDGLGSPIFCGNCNKYFDVAQNFVGHLLDCLESQGKSCNSGIMNSAEAATNMADQVSSAELPATEIPIATLNRSKAVASRVMMDTEDVDDSVVVSQQIPCVLCLSVCEKPKGLHYHLVSNCQFIPTNQCWNCHEAFSSRTKLKGHYNTMRGNCLSVADQEAELVMETCPNCEMRFSSKEHLNEHINEHHTPAVYTCPDCDISYVYRHQLSEHEKSTHKQSMNKLHCCFVCGVRFRRELDLKIHKGVHLRKGFYVPGEVCDDNEERDGLYVGPTGPIYLGPSNACDESDDGGSEKDSASDDEPLENIAKRSRKDYKTTEEDNATSALPSSEGNGEDKGKTGAKTSGKNNQSQTGNEASSKLPPDDGNNAMDGTSYKCELCDTHCISQEELKSHIQTHAKDALDKLAKWGQSHSAAGISEGDDEGEPSGISDNVWLESQAGKFLCVPCRRSFDSDILYNNHLAVFHDIGQSTDVCEICGRQCTTKANLKSHMRTHSTEMPYSCDICNKGFNQHGNMVRHRQGHGATSVRSVNAIIAAENRVNDLPEFSCSCCERTFEREDLLLNHLAVFHGIGSSTCICEVCGKQITSRKNLKEHMKVHSKSKPFICEVCGKAFSQRGNLGRHRRNHMEKDAKEKQEKHFQCRVCDKIFTSKQLLTYHYGKHKKV
eukprot:Seg3718.2 transcript_id=Seg3718.2/GoldUCD/mRNA.D3Y31 product="Zinc finger protein Xfin" protein_id=Seg3718.2/GoldUCD/D3Y31